jgi:hypothetical protein
MALADFVPVILFGISALLLLRDLKNKMSKGSYACLQVGACAAFLAGFLKALYKLLIGLGVGAFPLLNDIFLPLQSSGLLLTGLSIVLMLALRKKAALMAPLTGGFIGMMVLGLGGMCAGLGVVAAKMKKKALIPVFILCFFCYMGMGYLAAKKDGSAASNWIEQGVNTLGQILLLCGVATLDKAGLREFSLSR